MKNEFPSTAQKLASTGRPRTVRTILVTGGCGFIFSNFIRHILKKYPDYRVITLDNLSYSGLLENTEDLARRKNYRFVKGDIRKAEDVEKVLASEKIDCIINGAAQTHVDRSILNSGEFIETNVKGTQVLLKMARKFKIPLFIQIGTDEEYGDIPAGIFVDEDANLRPSNPYAASKAASSLLALSYYQTFGLPVIIVRPSNNFGPYQFPEKFIPLFITNTLEGKTCPLYGDGFNKRDWLFVEDCCEAIDVIMHYGLIGEIYNVGTGVPKTNLFIVEALKERLPNLKVEKIEDRPGHDRRYAMNCEKVRALGWKPQTPFSEALRKTVNWYILNEAWWKKIKSSPAFQEYYRKQYERS